MAILFKNLGRYAENICTYCAELDKYENLIAGLDEDLAIDRYQDTQPGGGDCVAKNRAKYDKYVEELSKLNAFSVFGDLYKGNETILTELLDRLYDSYSTFDNGLSISEAIKLICEYPEYTDKELTPDNIGIIAKVSEQLKEFYNPETDEIEISEVEKEELLKKTLENMKKILNCKEKILIELNNDMTQIIAHEDGKIYSCLVMGTKENITDEIVGQVSVTNEQDLFEWATGQA